jgi:hypothetical protein
MAGARRLKAVNKGTIYCSHTGMLRLLCGEKNLNYPYDYLTLALFLACIRIFASHIMEPTIFFYPYILSIIYSSVQRAYFNSR